MKRIRTPLIAVLTLVAAVVLTAGLAAATTNAAKGQVSALFLELDAQRGEHVQEPAYIVLHTLALLLQSQLAR